MLWCALPRRLASGCVVWSRIFKSDPLTEQKRAVYSRAEGFARFASQRAVLQVCRISEFACNAALQANCVPLLASRGSEQTSIGAVLVCFVSELVCIATKLAGSGSVPTGIGMLPASSVSKLGCNARLLVSSISELTCNATLLACFTIELVCIVQLFACFVIELACNVVLQVCELPCFITAVSTSRTMPAAEQFWRGLPLIFVSSRKSARKCRQRLDLCSIEKCV